MTTLGNAMKGWWSPAAEEAHNREIYFTQTGDQKGHPKGVTGEGLENAGNGGEGRALKAQETLSSKLSNLTTLSPCISISSSVKIQLTSGTFHAVMLLKVSGQLVCKYPAPGKLHCIAFLRIALEAEIYCFVRGLSDVKKE